MKISRVKLENFKRFENLEIKIQNSLLEEVPDRYLILGDNGTGKTTVLQAIALCLSMISHVTKGPDDFSWISWVSGRYYNLDKPKVEIDVHFTDDEITATHEAWQLWKEYQSSDIKLVEPGHSNKVTVILDRSRYQTTGDRNEIYQFWGRYYAASINRNPEARKLFEQLPGVFWFDQYRNLAVSEVDAQNSDDTKNGYKGRVSAYEFGVKRLRDYLISWSIKRQSATGNTPDYYEELRNIFQLIFPGRDFAPPEPMYRPGEVTPYSSYFMFSDGSKAYDIEEMSAGEQSIFPILYEFVRQRIRNSVVLIDEVDLNLHPPLAQAFLNALSQIGPGCQFIFTTHSEAVTNIVSSEEIFRLEGGKLCL